MCRLFEITKPAVVIHFVVIVFLASLAPPIRLGAGLSVVAVMATWQMAALQVATMQEMVLALVHVQALAEERSAVEVATKVLLGPEAVWPDLVWPDLV